jgi:hypothetical protein
MNTKQNDTSYLNEKIAEAMLFLVVGDKPLRDRITDAHLPLMKATRCHEDFEEDVKGDFRVIEECLASVRHGDYSRVTQEQLVTVATTVIEMYRRLPDVPVCPEGLSDIAGAFQSH